MRGDAGTNYAFIPDGTVPTPSTTKHRATYGGLFEHRYGSNDSSARVAFGAPFSQLSIRRALYQKNKMARPRMTPGSLGVTELQPGSTRSEALARFAISASAKALTRIEGVDDDRPSEALIAARDYLTRGRAGSKEKVITAAERAAKAASRIQRRMGVQPWSRAFNVALACSSAARCAAALDNDRRALQLWNECMRFIELASEYHPPRLSRRA